MARVKSKAKPRQKPVQKGYVSRNRTNPNAPAYRPEPEKPAEPTIPTTKTELLAEIGVVFDAVDRKMEERTWQIHFGHFGEFRDEGLRIEALVAGLHKVLADEGGDPDQDLTGPVIQEAFGAAPGTVPTWARPGRFLVWIDYVPCLCLWGGFADPQSCVSAADPGMIWMAPSGSISARLMVPSGCKTPEELFRNMLAVSTQATTFTNGRKPGAPAFNLHKLESWVKDELRADLAKPENAWLVAALRRGPVRPIPLPAHLQAVQMALFA
jgi:hypothetical protein